MSYDNTDYELDNGFEDSDTRDIENEDYNDAKACGSIEVETPPEMPEYPHEKPDEEIEDVPKVYYTKEHDQEQDTRVNVTYDGRDFTRVIEEGEDPHDKTKEALRPFRNESDDEHEDVSNYEFNLKDESEDNGDYVDIDNYEFTLEDDSENNGDIENEALPEGQEYVKAGDLEGQDIIDSDDFRVIENDSTDDYKSETKETNEEQRGTKQRFIDKLRKNK